LDSTAGFHIFPAIGAAFEVAIAEKPVVGFIRSRTRVVQRYPKGGR
jgi:hypothetical protein